VGDRIDGWWNQLPPQDSKSELWSKCRKEKDPFQGKKKRALEARKLEVSLDRAGNVIESGTPFSGFFLFLTVASW
jgi:hypothetical protein